MSWIEGGFTHGGNGFFTEMWRQLVTAGWAETEHIGARAGEWSSAPAVQTNTERVSMAMAAQPLDTYFNLPISMIGDDTTIRRDTTTATEGVDYIIDRPRGRMQILTGGSFDGGGGLGSGTLNIDPGYSLKKGWMILTSLGVSGGESIVIGIQFNGVGTVSNPTRVGARWTAFDAWAVGATVYEAEAVGTRNNLADDVLQYLSPRYEGTYQMSINLDRIICNGFLDCVSAWCYAGGLTRFRPVVEQDYVTAIAGCTAYDINNDDEGIVGKTDEPGQMDAQHGSVWMYDVSRFCAIDVAAELNANRWENEVGNSLNGYTPSLLVLNDPVPVGDDPQYYFELHDVIAGRNIDQLNSQTSILYGLWDGLKAVLVTGARHNLELTWMGTTHRLWKVGSSGNRFVAVEKV